MKIYPEDKYFHTSFASTDVACIYIWLWPVEGPFILIPCMEKVDTKTDFWIKIFASNYI